MSDRKPRGCTAISPNEKRKQKSSNNYVNERNKSFPLCTKGIQRSYSSI